MSAQTTLKKTIEFYHIGNRSQYDVELIDRFSYDIPSRTEAEIWLDLYSQIYKTGHSIIRHLVENDHSMIGKRLMIVAIDSDYDVYQFGGNTFDFIRYGSYMTFTKPCGRKYIETKSQKPEKALSGGITSESAEKIIKQLRDSVKTHNIVSSFLQNPIRPPKINNIQYSIKKPKKELLDGLKEVRSFVESNRCRDGGKLDYYLQVLKNLEFFVQQCDWK